MKRDRLAADVALATGVLCIAWSGLLVRWAGVNGLSAAFYRMTIGAAVLGPWCLARMRNGQRISSRLLLMTALSGALFACDNALFNIAVQRTAVAVATLLANISPLFVGAGDWFFFRRRPGREFWIGAGLTTVGCALIAPLDGVRGLTLPQDPGALTGGLLAIIASAFFAGYLLVTERARASTDTVPFTALTVCWSAVFLVAACAVAGAPFRGFPPHSWAALVALGLVSQVGGYLAITYALGHLPATVTSVGLLAQAPVTAAIASVWIGEELSARQIGGGLLVLAGVYLVTRRRRPSRVRVAAPLSG